jgi:CheY-like chemotaxis protein
VPGDLPAVALDPEHLHQVLTALLDNARESLMGPGSISVSARVVDLGPAECQDLFGAARPGPHVEIVIADTGTGLSPEVQRRLFADPFFTTKPRRRGFGLAMAYGILHAHRGGLRLHPGEERGVVARALLPVAPSPAAPAPGAAALLAPEKARGERILVVDDEAKVLQVVTVALEQVGFRVEAVSSGEAALQAYFAQPTDPFRLVLTDVIMPGMGGVELARRLLRGDPGVRVLFMSGHVPADHTRQELGSHPFELLAKPFRPDQLVRTVRAALDRPLRPRGRAEAPVQEKAPGRSGEPPVLSAIANKGAKLPAPWKE